MKKKNISREVARTLGDKTYFGEPCKKCGKAERYAVNSACVECTKGKAKARYATDEGRRVQATRDRKRYRDRTGKEEPDNVWD